MSLGFGRHFTDHMLTGTWNKDTGWGPLTVGPREALSMDPAASVLHYGQMLFDGFKAFHGNDGAMRVFRLDAHLRRLEGGASRMVMPPIDVAKTQAGVLALLDKERAQLPTGAGEAFYVRPFVMATEPFLGVRPAGDHLLLVILSKVGSYYDAEGRGLRIWTEREHTRAAPGGLGAVKTAANYAASLAAAARAKQFGYDQVLWLDAKEHRIVEEVGTMNVFFRIGDTVVTPALTGTLLAGITRDSVLTLLRTWGVKVQERSLTIDELRDASRKGELLEAFGTGTAAVISPMGELAIGDHVVKLAPNGEVATRLLTELVGIQRGTRPDPFGWMTQV